MRLVMHRRQFVVVDVESGLLFEAAELAVAEPLAEGGSGGPRLANLRPGVTNCARCCRAASCPFRSNRHCVLSSTPMTYLAASRMIAAIAAIVAVTSKKTLAHFVTHVAH